MEPQCLFRVLRDGPRVALASLAADGQLLCTAGADSLGLVACSSGQWAAAGASWEQVDGVLCNSRRPEKASNVLRCCRCRWWRCCRHCRGAQPAPHTAVPA